MSIVYKGFGGFGVNLTEEIKKNCINLGLFTENEYSDCPYECFEKVNSMIKCSRLEVSGNSYSGNEKFCFLISGKNIREAVNNSEKFCESFNNLNICSHKISKDNVELIEGVNVY